MSGRIQKPVPEKWRNQDHIKPNHRIREVKMPAPTRADPDQSTIGFGIGSGASGGGSVGDGPNGDSDNGKLPTTIRRAPIIGGNSVSEAPEVAHDDPKTQLRSKQHGAYRRPVVPANTAKDSILGEHVQGPVSQRHGDRRTQMRGTAYDGAVYHSHRQADPEIEI